MAGSRTLNFKEYFEWVPADEPDKMILVCKKECWIDFWPRGQFVWEELRNEIPNWEYKILEDQTRQSYCSFHMKCIFIDYQPRLSISSRCSFCSLLP